MLSGVRYARAPITLTVSCTPSEINQTTKFASGNTSGVTASASGGTAPYTYAWTIENDGGLLSINAPAVAATSFAWTDLESLDETQSDFRVTATDSHGNTGYQIITVYVARIEF